MPVALTAPLQTASLCFHADLTVSVALHLLATRAGVKTGMTERESEEEMRGGGGGEGGRGVLVFFCYCVGV